MHRLFAVFAAVFVVAWPSGAQQFERRANMVGNGGGDRGKCTIEVVVDGIAEVEIRGDRGIIRNIAGQPAQWRRFQCSAPLPRNPAEFRFQGDRKSTRLNSSHLGISYAVFCLKKDTISE